VYEEEDEDDEDVDQEEREGEEEEEERRSVPVPETTQAIPTYYLDNTQNKGELGRVR